jgi:hypothetical protein
MLRGDHFGDELFSFGEGSKVLSGQQYCYVVL